MLGISAANLTGLFIILVIILLLLIAFILSGVAWFTYGGNFGAFIQSLLPIGAGAGVAQKSTADPEENSFK